MELAGLARPDSLYLLAQVLRKHDTSLDDERFEKDNLEALLDVLDDHPLSIELVGPHLKQLTPEQIVARFHELLDQFTGDAEVERNRSLLASLRFSTSRLSAQAQAALPWLGLFQGGVFEQILLDVGQMDPLAWDGMRAELEATALVRVETDIEINYRPICDSIPRCRMPSEGWCLPMPPLARQMQMTAGSAWQTRKTSTRGSSRFTVH